MILVLFSICLLVLAIVSVDKKTVQYINYAIQSLYISKKCKQMQIEVMNGLGTFYRGKQNHFLEHFNYGDPTKEIIIGVAIKTNHNVINATLGMHRHADITLYLDLKDYFFNTEFDTAGFLTSTGRFVNRVEAKKIAIMHNQVIEERGKFRELISEELKHGYWE